MSGITEQCSSCGFPTRHYSVSFTDGRKVTCDRCKKDPEWMLKAEEEGADLDEDRRTKPCPTCGGFGRVPDDEGLEEEARREFTAH